MLDHKFEIFNSNKRHSYAYLNKFEHKFDYFVVSKTYGVTPFLFSESFRTDEIKLCDLLCSEFNQIPQSKSCEIEKFDRKVSFAFTLKEKFKINKFSF